MKFKTLFLSIVVSVFIIAGCSKDDDNNPVTGTNSNLLNKSLPEIRNAITGTWQVQYGYVYGITGVQKLTPPAGQGDLFRFLSNDTLKRSTYNDASVILNAKASIYKIKSSGYPAYDSVYVFDYPSSEKFIMQEIKNDTLIIDAGLATGGGSNYYLTKKQ